MMYSRPTESVDNRSADSAVATAMAVPAWQLNDNIFKDGFTTGFRFVLMDWMIVWPVAFDSEK